MPHKLYVIHGSHPCATVEAALRMKGIPYKRVELMPPLHFVHQRLRFGPSRVPAIRLESGEKISGSRAICRWAEELVPEPALYPSDPEARAKVEEAERWGDDVLQPLARRVLWPAIKRRPSVIPSFQEHSKLPVPGFMATMSGPMIARVEIRANETSDDIARADVAALPGHLDKIDAWIAEGVLGGEQPNAADLQVASSVRLLMTVGDVRPMIESRPAGELAMRHFGDYDGEIPVGTLPADWFAAQPIAA